MVVGISPSFKNVTQLQSGDIVVQVSEGIGGDGNWSYNIANNKVVHSVFHIPEINKWQVNYLNGDMVFLSPSSPFVVFTLVTVQGDMGVS